MYEKSQNLIPLRRREPFLKVDWGCTDPMTRLRATSIHEMGTEKKV